MARRQLDPQQPIQADGDATGAETRARWSASPRPRAFAPSLRPNSIFTLRPLYRTEQPPDAREGEPPTTPRARRTWPWAAGGLVVGLGLAGLVLLSVDGERREAPVVLINGTPQLKPTNAGGVQRWTAGATVLVVIDPSVDELGRGASDAVMNAFGAWLGSGAKLPKLRFETRRAETRKVERDGVSSVVHAPITIPGHRDDLAITIGYSDADTGRILEADVVINSAKSFAVLDGDEKRPGATRDDASRCGYRYDLQNVITHEVGHFFGLGEDGDDLNATMFFKTGKCELKKRDLEPLDTSTMVGLYAQDTQPTEADPASGCAVSGNGRGRKCGALALALLLAGAGRRRERAPPG
jgi:hypothetical protein